MGHTKPCVPHQNSSRGVSRTAYANSYCNNYIQTEGRLCAALLLFWVGMKDFCEKSYCGKNIVSTFAG